MGLAELDQWLAALRRTMDLNYARLDALLAEKAPAPGKDPT